MAVKVMVAPAIASGELKGGAPPERRRGDAGAPRKPRRRSAVYDGDGREVFITLMCLKCRKMKPLGQFGLRRMADGAIRNQPWCRPCRSGSRAEGLSRVAEAPPPEDLQQAAPAAAPAPKPLSASAIAAQVAAAIVWNK